MLPLSSGRNNTETLDWNLHCCKNVKSRRMILY